MSDPSCGPRACDIVAINIFRFAGVLSKAKLNKDINLAERRDKLGYSLIYVQSSLFPLYQIFYYFPLHQHNHHVVFIFCCCLCCYYERMPQ
jgi:hypothetical protein